VLGADVFVAQPLRFFGGVGEHALALVGERQIDRSRDLFAHRGVLLNLFADGFNRCVRTKKAIRESFIFAQEA